MIKHYIKNFTLILCTIIFGTGTIIMNFVLFPLIKLFNKDVSKRYNKYSEFIYISWKFMVKILIFLKIIKINLKNKNKLKNIKNSIIVASHPSYIDVLILISLIPKTTSFVAPRLQKNIIFKNIVNSMFLLSGTPLITFKEEAENLLNQGFNLIIFPSGTRHKHNENPKIKKGAAYLSIETERDIVPVQIITNKDFLQKGVPLFETGGSICEYDITVKNKIDVKNLINKEPDKITLRKEITSKIWEALYK